MTEIDYRAALRHERISTTLLLVRTAGVCFCIGCVGAWAAGEQTATVAVLAAIGLVLTIAGHFAMRRHERRRPTEESQDV